MMVIRVNKTFCDGLLLRKKLNEFKPDLIVNFAAESHVDNSIKSPNDFIQTNKSFLKMV